MQLNIHIPKEKAGVLLALERLAEETKRSKDELVLEALERYLAGTTPVTLKEFRLGNVKLTRRADLYERSIT